MRAKGKLIAINGSGKTSADRGMRAFLRNGASQVVVSDVLDIVLPDAIATIGRPVRLVRVEKRGVWSRP